MPSPTRPAPAFAPAAAAPIPIRPTRPGPAAAAPRSARLASSPEPAAPKPARPAPATSSSAPSPAPAAPKPRVDALDGLRTFAILSVVAYHLGVWWLPSGHMGVVIFLVLTGYLVAGSVLREIDRTGTVRLLKLWGRRIKRLWPAMALMVAGVAALCTVFDHVLLTKMRPDALPALAFFANWHYILEGASYFGQIGAPSPLTHLWYLGVDLQSCLLLPPILLLCAGKARMGRGATAAVLTVLAVASALLMGLIYDPATDPSRVYYGTDTRIFSVFLGAVLACAWPLGALPRWLTEGLAPRPQGARFARPQTPAASPLASAVLNALGIAALFAIMAIQVFVPSGSSFFYYGGMFLVSLLAALLIAALSVPDGLLARVFAFKPLAWMGARSYGLYLWHYPIIILMGAYGEAPWWLMLAALAVSVVATQLSWVLLETPVASGRAAAAWRFLCGRQTEEDRAARKKPLSLPGAILPPVAYTLLALFAVGGCIAVPHTTLVPEEQIRSTGASATQAMDLAAMQAAALSAGATAQHALASVALDARGYAVLVEVAVPDPEPVIPEGDMVVYAAPGYNASGLFEPFLIGDSVPGGMAFYEVFPNGFIDSYIGRRPAAAIDVLRGYVEQGVVGHNVVVASFSNTTAWPEQLDELVSIVGPDRTLFLVATVNPEGFQDTANWYLMDCAARYENVFYVDWPATVAGHEWWCLWGDGIHLTPDGGWAYAQMVARAVAPNMVAAGGEAVPA